MQTCKNCEGTGLQPNVNESLTARSQYCAECNGSGTLAEGEENVVLPETLNQPLPAVVPPEDIAPSAPAEPEIPADVAPEGDIGAPSEDAPVDQPTE